MSVFVIIMRVISLVCIGSLLICGMYLSTNKEKITDYNSSARFHKTLGIVTAIVSTVTILI